MASFLFQGDTAGAAAVMPHWDGGPAGADPWYQMVAGATLERAGDARARDRYATAAKLDPALVIAQVGQARATAMEGDAQEAMRLAQALRTSMPDRAEPVALVALAWGRDPNRESLPVPPEVDEVGRRAADLPSGLKFVPHAVAALRAFDKHDGDEARAEILKGLAVAESPGAAVWLGTIALPLGDEALARKGALAALQLSAVYEPARALAARVALLGGRLDEALKATEDLDATSPDVAVVRAAAAYERVDADGVIRALEALPAEARKLPFLAALVRAPDAVNGKLPLDGATDRGHGGRRRAVERPRGHGYGARRGRPALGGQGRRVVGNERGVESAASLAPGAPGALRGQARRGGDALADGPGARNGDAAGALGARLLAGRAQPRRRGGAAPVALPAGPRPAGHLAERVRGGVGREHRGRQRADRVDSILRLPRRRSRPGSSPRRRWRR